MIRISLAIALVAGSLLTMIRAEPASAATVLERIKAAGKISLGYREEAAPFSYKNDQGQPAGYSIEICAALVEDLKAMLGVPGLLIEWVPVTIDDRFAAVQQGKVDLLCGATTETLSRRKTVSFSVPIFRGGIGVMVRSDASAQFRNVLNGEPPGPVWRGSPARLLEKKTFAVVKGTTSEEFLTDALRRLQISINVTEVDSYQAGAAALLDRSVDALVGDRAILVEGSQSSAEPENLLVVDRTFSTQLVGLPLDRNDADFRLAVDTALSKLYRSDRFDSIYRKWFGTADQGTLDFFRNAGLPE